MLVIVSRRLSVGNVPHSVPACVRQMLEDHCKLEARLFQASYGYSETLSRGEKSRDRSRRIAKSLGTVSGLHGDYEASLIYRVNICTARACLKKTKKHKGSSKKSAEEDGISRRPEEC